MAELLCSQHKDRPRLWGHELAWWGICERSHIRTAARPPAQSKTESFPCKCTVWHPQLDPFEENDRRFEGRQFPLLVHLTKPEKLPGLPPPFAALPFPCAWPLKAEREGSIDQGDRWAARPASCLLPRIVFISSLNPVAMALKMALQPLCLMISWMIAYLSGIHALFCWNARRRGMSCCCLKRGGALIWPFYSELNWWWTWRLWGYLPDETLSFLVPGPAEIHRSHFMFI